MHPSDGQQCIISSKYKLTGYCPVEWHISGRKPVMTITSFDSKIEKHLQSTGRAVTHQDIRKWFTDARTTTAKKTGFPYHK